MSLAENHTPSVTSLQVWVAMMMTARSLRILIFDVGE